MPPKRRQVLFSGRVQGVGFRYTTCHVANRFAVTGYVRNLPDGRVELVAEGEPGELDNFVVAVEDAMAGCVANTETSESEARGEFARFDVRF